MVINQIIREGDYSILDQGLGANNLKTFDYIKFDDEEINSGGFGKIHQIISIDGEEKEGLLLKIFEKKEYQKHAFDVIKYLHLKIKRFQKKHVASIYQTHPELLGLPFVAFHGFNEIKGEFTVGFIMYDLKAKRYIDYGADDGVEYRFEIGQSLLYSYQLAKAVNFLHKINFFHSDLKEDAIFINLEQNKLCLIDFDSGYHPSIQSKPATIGAVNFWQYSTGFLNRIFGKNQGRDIRFQENWVLNNAIFQFFSSSKTPYTFLKDAEETTRAKYLKHYTWPQAGNDQTIFQEGAEKDSLAFKNLLENFKSSELESLSGLWEQTFNGGYKKDKKISTSEEWLMVLRSIIESEFSLKVISLDVDNPIIKKPNQIVNISWEAENVNFVRIENRASIIGSQNIELAILDECELQVEFVNDFESIVKKLKILTDKSLPLIHFFESDKDIRDSELPISLFWEVENFSHLKINDKTLKSKNNSLQVYPLKSTNYTLTAVGHFGQETKRTIEVRTVQPQVIEFRYEVNLDHGLDNVDVIWETKNAKKVKLLPIEQSLPLQGKEHIKIDGGTKFTLVVQGLYGTVQETILAKPFPIPIIKELMVEFPKIEINSRITSTSLKVPGNLANCSSINFNNSMEIHPISLNLPPIEISVNSKLPEFNRTLNLIEKKGANPENYFNILLKKILAKFNFKLN